VDVEVGRHSRRPLEFESRRQWVGWKDDERDVRSNEYESRRLRSNIRRMPNPLKESFYDYDRDLDDLNDRDQRIRSQFESRRSVRRVDDPLHYQYERQYGVPYPVRDERPFLDPISDRYPDRDVAQIPYHGIDRYSDRDVGRFPNRDIDRYPDRNINRYPDRDFNRYHDRYVGRYPNRGNDRYGDHDPNINRYYNDRADHRGGSSLYRSSARDIPAWANGDEERNYRYENERRGVSNSQSEGKKEEAETLMNDPPENKNSASTSKKEKLSKKVGVRAPEIKTHVNDTSYVDPFSEDDTLMSSLYRMMCRGMMFI
jgi:hypothetical protein